MVGYLLLPAFVLGLIVIILLLSPGKPFPFIDEKGMPLSGAISEKRFVKINGVDQGMFIISKDESNPVLLFLHGGPGMPEYFLTEQYPTGLEDIFTVVWWEQRGAGLSYRSDISPETLTVEQVISDTIEVTNYLRKRFNKEKIFLMGHSWGSFIGVQAASRAPELYQAYIGVGQMSYQLKSENLAYEYMLQKSKEIGDRRMLQKLENNPVTMTIPLPDSYLALRDEAMHRLGIGTTRNMKSVVTGIFFPSLRSRVYTADEKVNLWRGKIFSRKILWNQMLAVNLIDQIARLDLPVYFFIGRYDLTVSCSVAEEFFEKIKAPVKGFYFFEHSAHSPIFEEPDKALKILRVDVLLGGNQLADLK